jgi:lipopolysaccharide/colanic/teichoic acid biosynthesis glycosyltransferase
MSACPCAQPSVEESDLHTNNERSPEMGRTQTTLLHFPRTDPHGLPAVAAWINSRRRRVLDCIVATAILLVCAPVFLLLSLLVRLSSPGPVFFRQRRMGRHGIEFTLYKFRSMHVSSASGSPITVVGDSRITPIGAILRRYKLDELPQFWNVLKGDMSLVGPRPKLPEHEGLFLHVRPGITGAATLAFRKEEELLARIPRHQLESFYQEVVKPSKAWIDTEYITSATFRSDLRLLSDTCASCLGFVRLRSTEEWIALYWHARTSETKPSDHQPDHRNYMDVTVVREPETIASEA